MTILTEEQFQEFIEENPEMEQCYDLSRYDFLDTDEDELIANA